MKFDKLHLVLLLLVLGMLLYMNFCSEQDTLTKQEGKRLEAKSEQALAKLESLFEHLKKIDSIKIIQNYYSTNYYNEKKTKDSLLNVHPELGDSVFIDLVRRLSAEPSPIK